MVLQTIRGPGTKATVKVDDVSLRDGACRPPGSCDFEFGQCNWLNVHREDGHDWVLANGGFRGPETDHTTQTPEGRYTLTCIKTLTYKRKIPPKENNTFFSYFWISKLFLDQNIYSFFIRGFLFIFFNLPLQSFFTFWIGGGVKNWFATKQSYAKSKLPTRLWLMRPAVGAVQPPLLLNNFSFAYPWLMSCSWVKQPTTHYFLMSVWQELWNWSCDRFRIIQWTIIGIN